MELVCKGVSQLDCRADCCIAKCERQHSTSRWLAGMHQMAAVSCRMGFGLE